MKQILVAIDFSENAGKALHAAKLIASKTGAKLTLLHVYQPDIVDVSIPVTPNSAPIFEAVEKSFKQQFEEHVVSTVAEGFEVEGIWAAGSIMPTILHQARLAGADLIVLGRTGKGGFFDKLIGSSATGVALEAHCPVLVIPPQTVLRDFREVVYATQLEYEESDILSQVLGFTKTLNAHLTFLKVRAPKQPDIQPDRQFIDQMTQELGIAKSEIKFTDGGSVSEGIEDYCNKVKADLLIVSTRERDFLEQLIINPSLTKKMIVETHIPLLVHHLQ